MYIRHFLLLNYCLCAPIFSGKGDSDSSLNAQKPLNALVTSGNNVWASLLEGFGKNANLSDHSLETLEGFPVDRLRQFLKLDLSKNKLEDISGILPAEETFPLKMLLISSNLMSYIPATLSDRYSELVTLNLDDNNICSSEGLQGIEFDRLTTLNLSNNYLIEVAGLGKSKLPSLANLNLSHNLIRDFAPLSKGNFYYGEKPNLPRHFTLALNDNPGSKAFLPDSMKLYSMPGVQTLEVTVNPRDIEQYHKACAQIKSRNNTFHTRERK